MTITRDFEFFSPQKEDEVLELLDRYGNRAELLAGGTDLIVNLKENLIEPEAVIDIKRVAGLKKIEVSNKTLFIGAKATFSDILASGEIQDRFLLLWEAARSVASVGIRNRATLVGNICSAVPCMDSAPALLCYEATVHLLGRSGEREVPISDWFRKPRKTARKDDELVTGVSIVRPDAVQSGCYVKLGRYGGEDLAQAGLGILMTGEYEYRIAYTAVAPVPFRAVRIEDLLAGRRLSSELLGRAKELVGEEIKPISDIRASKAYREHMCRVMLERGLYACLDRLEGKVIDTVRILGG